MHYIFIPCFCSLIILITQLYYDSTNTFVATDVEYLHMQLQMPLLCVDVALSRRLCMFCAN